MKQNRRTFLKTATALALALNVNASRAQQNRHTVVIVTLTGGFDHSMLLPIFTKNSTSILSPAVHYANQNTFDFYNTKLINNPRVLSPDHPLIAKYGNLLSFTEGIYMDGQNDHVSALAVLVRCSTSDGPPSFAAMLAELLGAGTQHGCVSFGKAPYHSGNGLSPFAQGISLPSSLSTAQNMISSDFSLDDLSQQDLDDAAREFYHSQAGGLARFNANADQIRGVLKDFRAFSTDITAGTQQKLLEQFTLEPQILAPYLAINHPYGQGRHEPLAAAAKMINTGNVAGCFMIPLGFLEGFNSYDTHNDFSNDEKQQQMLQMDFTALSIFLDQIGPRLQDTTVIVQSEFGRTPLLNAAGGKDHWGFNNAFMVISPLIRPGRFGNVNPLDYAALPLEYNDGSSNPISCRGFYRGFLEMLVERQLTTAPQDKIESLMRQFLRGPVPKGLFS